MQIVFRVYSDGGPKNTMFRIDDVSLSYVASAACTTPGTPSSATGTQTGQTSANLSWTAGSPAGSSTVTYYWVVGTSSSVQYGGSGVIAQGTTNGTSTTTSALSCGTTYYLRVYAKTNCDGTSSGYRTSSSFSTPTCSTTCTTPGTPASAIGTQTGQTSASLSWTAGSPVGSSTVTYYWVVGTSSSVQYGGSGVVAQGSTNGTNASTSALSCGTNYYLRVYAKTDCDGTSSGYRTSSSFSTSSCTNNKPVGIDVHAEKGTINWSQVYAPANKTFAFAKATKGVCYIDSKFTTNMVNGKSAGVVMGAYHYALPEDNTAIAEANYFVNAAGSYIGINYLPPALDLEDPEGTCLNNNQPLSNYFTSSKLAQWVNNWSDRVHTLTGIWPVLYTTRCYAGILYPYYQSGIINSNIKLWIADTSKPAGSPSNSSACDPWIGWPWVFHQYSWTGVVSGISGAVDLDVFNGDINAFNSLIGSNSTCTDQHESNNSAATASLVFASPVANSSNLQWQGNIGFVGDDDWYRINIGACGTVTVNLSNLPNDYDIELWDKYSITVGQGTVLSGSYNTGNSNETVSFSYQGSNTAFIKIYAKNHQSYTTNSCYNIQFIFTPCTGGQPTNDICANATPLTVNSTCIPLTNQYLTNANSEESPIYCLDSHAEIGYDVWYKFIATGTNQTIDFNNNGSFDAFISLYTDCSDNNQSSFQIACDNKQGAITIPASGLTVGKPYFIRIHDFYGYAQNKPFSICVTGSSLPQTPTITASQTSLPDFGNVQVSTNSSPQNYTVSGSNLTANITLSAPTGFQISTSSSSSFGSTVTLTQSGGTISSTPIYVRFSPSSTGIQSGNISITSTGATTKYVSVSGTGSQTCTPPTSQASAITFSGVNTNFMTANWTNGNGSRRVVKINISNSFTAPGTGTDPTANTSYSGSGEQVVYNGSSNNVTVTGLSAGTTYWFRVYEINCTGSSTFYSTVTASNNPNSQITSSSCIAPNSGIISPSNPTVTAPNSINLTVTANGTAPFTYQWYLWNGSAWTALTNSSPYSGVTTQTLSINSTTTSMNGYYYTCLVSNSCGNQNNINYVQLALSSYCTTPIAPATCTSSIGNPANGLIHTLNLSCDIVPDADGYFFEYSVDGTTWNTNWGPLTTNDISINIQDQPNVTRYYRVRAYKCNPVIYSQYTYASPQPIYTACDDPATPTVNGATSSSLNITLNSETPVANPSITTYSIYCSTTSQYIQANGTLGSSEVFQTKSAWGTKTIAGLLSNKDYCFYAKAKNNDGDIRYNTQNNACAKTSNSPPAIVLATITTSATTAISISTASGGGNVTADGGAPVTARGVCWSTTTNPITSDSKTSDGTGIGSFTSNITGLTADITYHVRAYAINSAGTAYGLDVSFTTYPKPPTIASIAQPTCALSTGSVALTDLPANGSWIITQNPGGKTFSGSGTSKTITGLAAGVYSFTVTNSAGNTSDPSLSATINSPFATPLIPIVGTITQPTCSVSTGSVVLNGLPSTGTWILNPGSISGSGTSKTLTGLASGKYNFNVTNASGCVSASTVDIVINSPSTAPATPTIGTITQPTCSVSTGSVVLNGLPSTGTWILNPGAISGSGTSKTLTGLSSGTYNFSVTNAAGCASSNSAGVVIDPQPTLPSIGTLSGTTTVCQGQNTVSYTVSTIANATSYVWILPSGASGSSTTNSINVNFGTSAVSGNITVKGHNDCGDGAVSSLSIAVNQLPMNAGSISGSSNVCQGLSSVTYSVPIINNATSYIWTLPSGVSGSSTTNSIIVNYGPSAVSGNIKVKGHNACGDGVESALVVNVYPVPVAPVISINSGILQSNSSSGNQWVLDNNIIQNAVNYQYTPSQAGNYYVIVTLNGCASPASNTIAYIPTGIEEVVENKGISMYPNPTTGLVKILISDKMDSNYSVDVYNSNGSLLRELKKDRSVSDFDVDLSQYPAGIYIISIKSTGIFYKNKVAKRN